MELDVLPEGFHEMLSFGLIEAILGPGPDGSLWEWKFPTGCLHTNRGVNSLPSILIITCLQAHHLDPDFYDRFYKPGVYLDTRKRHMQCWHG